MNTKDPQGLSSEELRSPLDIACEDAKVSFMANGFTEEQAASIVALISIGLIDRVSISEGIRGANNDGRT